MNSLCLQLWVVLYSWNSRSWCSLRTPTDAKLVLSYLPWQIHLLTLSFNILLCFCLFCCCFFLFSLLCFFLDLPPHSLFQHLCPLFLFCFVVFFCQIHLLTLSFNNLLCFYLFCFFPFFLFPVVFFARSTSPLSPSTSLPSCCNEVPMPSIKISH